MASAIIKIVRSPARRCTSDKNLNVRTGVVESDKGMK